MRDRFDELEATGTRFVAITPQEGLPDPTVWNIDEDEDGTLGDLVEDLESDRPADVATFSSLQDQLAMALEGLNDREREVLAGRYGLRDREPETLEVLAERDPKGLYRKAMAGEIDNFTGVSDPYEPPLNPEVVCHTDGRETPEQSAAKIVAVLEELGMLSAEPASRA